MKEVLAEQEANANITHTGNMFVSRYTNGSHFCVL